MDRRGKDRQEAPTLKEGAAEARAVTSINVPHASELTF